MPPTRLDTARVHAARRVIDPVFLDTPLYRCEPLEPGLGCAVSIKLETANPVRSVKGRGTELVARTATASSAATSRPSCAAATSTRTHTGAGPARRPPGDDRATGPPGRTT